MRRWFGFWLGILLCPPLQAARTAIEFRPEAEAEVSLLASALIVLLAVAGIVFVLVRKKGGQLRLPNWAARRSSIRVLSSASVGAGARLVEVQYRDRVLLLGVTASGVQLIEAHGDQRESEVAS